MEQLDDARFVKHELIEIQGQMLCCHFSTVDIFSL